MSKPRNWDNSNDEKVLKLKSEGLKISEIAKKLDLKVGNVKNFLARHKRLMACGGTFKRQGGALRNLKPDETKRRMTVYEKGGSDKECASELGLTVSCFKSWRTSNNLPMNKRKKAQYYARKIKTITEIDECFELPVVEVKKEIDGLKPEHIDNYNHNINVAVSAQRTKDPVVIVDIGLAEKLAQQAGAKDIVAPLEDRMKAKKLVADLCVTASRSFGGDFVRC